MDDGSSHLIVFVQTCQMCLLHFHAIKCLLYLQYSIVPTTHRASSPVHSHRLRDVLHKQYEGLTINHLGGHGENRKANLIQKFSGKKKLRQKVPQEKSFLSEAFRKKLFVKI